MNIKIEKIGNMVKERLSEWEKSQQGQANGYEYEKSYAEMIHQIEQDIFKEMSETKTPNKNKKKQY